ncbi:hypothetical protein ACIP1G_26680 [Pseudomonas sp. NPDC089392]|uniref:hypothetical protein n=1 Tax=Pseudomonas sp. NPDC089392 TaxID=3364459 RepID=UPI0038306E17
MQPEVTEAPLYEDWLKKMETQLWTFGWDVLLAFDKGTTNILLRQEFIDRLGGENRFPFGRVLVVAKDDKDDKLISKALVSLVENDVSIYPLVASVNLGSKQTLSAATPDGADLTWEQPPEGLGAVTKDSDSANPQGQIYTAPVSLPKWVSGNPLYYYGLRHVPITVKPTAGGTAAIIDMLVVGPKSQNYWLEAVSSTEGSVQVEFYKADREGNKLPVTGNVEWTLVKGDGTLENKVYTPKSGSSEQYAIIVAFADDGESSDKFDVLILPLPFISIKRYSKLLDPHVMEIE